MKHNNNTVAVYTLNDTPVKSPEKVDGFLDHGLLINDLAAHGLHLVVANKRTFEERRVYTPVSLGDSGHFRYDEIALDPADIDAMHVRLATETKNPTAAATPSLNSNALKEFALSKYNLYEQILRDQQIETHYMSMQADDFDMMRDNLEALASDQVVLKSNSGAGGSSTKIFSKKEAMQWINDNIGLEGVKPQVLQAKVNFGELPQGITATDTDTWQPLIDRARQEKLLSELRFFVVKRGAEHDVVPLLRVVPDKSKSMSGSNDVYIEVALPDDLHEALSRNSAAILDAACEKSGAGNFAIGAIDYYFDEHQMPVVGDANLRSPALPTTDTTPRAGRMMHRSLARTMRAMIDEKDGQHA